VTILQAGEAANSKTSELIAQVNSQKQEIDRLRDALSGISKIVNTVGNCTTSAQVQSALDNTVPSDGSEQSQQGQPVFAIDELSGTLREPLPSNVLDGGNGGRAYLREDTSNVRLRYGRLLSESESTSRGVDSGTSSSPEDIDSERSHQLIDTDRRRTAQVFGRGNQQGNRSRSCVSQIAREILQNSSLDGRLWYLAGSILASILEAPDQQLTPSKYGEDIAIRAVLHGWSSTASQYDLDSGWQWLRQLDEALYSSLGIPERLAILRIMRLQYLVFTLGSRQARLER